MTFWLTSYLIWEVSKLKHCVLCGEGRTYHIQVVQQLLVAELLDPVQAGAKETVNKDDARFSWSAHCVSPDASTILGGDQLAGHHRRIWRNRAMPQLIFK